MIEKRHEFYDVYLDQIAKNKAELDRVVGQLQSQSGAARYKSEQGKKQLEADRKSNEREIEARLTRLGINRSGVADLVKKQSGSQINKKLEQLVYDEYNTLNRLDGQIRSAVAANDVVASKLYDEYTFRSDRLLTDVQKAFLNMQPMKQPQLAFIKEEKLAAPKQAAREKKAPLLSIENLKQRRGY